MDGIKNKFNRFWIKLYTYLYGILKLNSFKLNPEVYENKLIGFHLKWMKYYGYIISSDQNYELLHFCRSAVFTFTFISASFLSLLKIGNGIDNLAVTFHVIAFSISIANGFYYRPRFYRLIMVLHDDINNLLKVADQHELDIFQKTCKYISGLTKGLYLCKIAAVIVLGGDLIYAVISKPEFLLSEANFSNSTAVPALIFKLFPYHEIFNNFIVGYIAALLFVIVGCTTFVPWHTFIICLMAYIVLKIKIINYRLTNIRSKSNLIYFKRSIAEFSEEEKTYFELMKICINDQWNVRKFVKELEKLISFPVFMDFMIFTIIICFLLYNLTEAKFAVDFIFMLLFLFTVSGILWIYYYHANEISFYSELTVYSAYCSDWYNFPAPLRKMILLIMINSMEPLTMRPYLIRMNLSTLLTIFNSSYSYYNILKTIRK